jgi:hypothetical protein
MTDVIDRIKAGLNSDTPGRVEWRALLETALFEIERLRAWRDSKNEACEKLERENERLRAALEPFAKMANEVEFWAQGTGKFTGHFDANDLKRARALVTNGDRDAD